MNAQHSLESWQSLEELVSQITGSIFIVTGKKSYKACGAEDKIACVTGNHKIYVFNEFTSNPQLHEAQVGVELYRKVNPSLIIAIGGGSTLDVAKAIQFLADVNSDEHFDALKRPLDYQHPDKPPLVAIPTTFGTGSESTHFATIYVDDMKFSLAAPSCLPKYFLLDASLGRSASAYIKASCGVDALCQAIESFWAKGATTESRGYAENAIPLLIEALPHYVKDNPDNRYAEKMALGSNLAGKAINLSKTTAPHAISYAITQRYGIEHGQAVFLTLPFFFYKNCKQDQTGLMAQLLSRLNIKSPEEAIRLFYDLAQALHLKTRLDEIVSVSEDDVKTLAQQVNIERLGNHPFDVSEQDIIDSLLWDGAPSKYNSHSQKRLIRRDT